MKKRLTLIALAAMAFATGAFAQLSKNPGKFLGNITTSYNVDFGNEKYYTLWNQITCENESKWGSIEGTNNSFNFGGSDNAYNYAKSHNFPFKFHALVWGAQYPKWLESQTPAQRYKEIVQWMDKVKEHYPNLQLIDVVNEAVTGHQAGTPYFIEALGGTGKTGYDWLIKAFELAYERWPNAILIYNDFNTFQWNTDQYIDLVKTLRDAGAPIDAYGCQSHDLTDCSLTTFKNSMTKLQNALKMPMYSTEYDIGTDDDALQLQRYKEQIPYMWEADYVAGVTLWGYIYGRTWTTNGNSGIIKDGADRPAMKWLREYMQTDAAKNAKSPFPGMVKEASVYVKPEALNVEKGKETAITVRAKMKTKTIEKIDLYVKNVLVATMTEAPYEAKYTPSVTGNHELKAVVTCTDGTTYQRYSNIMSSNPRGAYRGTPTSLPGTLQMENFDTGLDGEAFHDTNNTKEGTGASYRTDIGGIDVEKGGTGYTVGYTQAGEWMEYTVDVKEAGLYSYGIYYSAPSDGVTVNMSLKTADGYKTLTDEKLVLPKTGDWSTFRSYTGRTLIPLEAGQQIIRFTIIGGNDTYLTNLDRITFAHVELNENMTLALSSDPEVGFVSTKVNINADVKCDTTVQNVKFYQDGVLKKTASSAPYFYSFTPTAKGTFTFTAIATDVTGKQSEIESYSLKVTPKRSPFAGVIDLPGTIEVENFDKGEEGYTYHDSDATNSGNSDYRSDAKGVDIKTTPDGGYGVGSTVKDEWLEYTVNVTKAGEYTCEAVASTVSRTSNFYVSLVEDEKVVKDLFRVYVSKTTAGADTYKTFTAKSTMELEEGQYRFRIRIVGAGADIDKLVFKCKGDVDGIDEIILGNESSNAILNISGQRVGDNYKGIIIRNGKKYLKR